MASGCVRLYEGKRGRVWFVQYTDATGRKVKERLGKETQGWTEHKARKELRARLAKVEQAGWRKPRQLTFTVFADRYMAEHLPSRNLKRSTLGSYRRILDGHLRPFFGNRPLADIDPELVDAYISHQTTAGLSPKTVTNHLLLLNTMLKRAVRWRLIASNPVEAVDRPRQRKPEMAILTTTQIARLSNAYTHLTETAPSSQREWWRLAHAVTFTALGTALRRGELLGLRWKDTELLQGRLHIRQAYVRGEITTPKSQASQRTIEIGPLTRELLTQHYQSSPYTTEGDLVFCHPTKGTPTDPTKLSKLMRQALNHAGIHQGFRVFHDLRHTALTHDAAAGNPHIYLQHRAGHQQASTTERYLHAAQTIFPGAAEKAETAIFAGLNQPQTVPKQVPKPSPTPHTNNQKHPNSRNFVE